MVNEDNDRVSGETLPDLSMPEVPRAEPPASLLLVRLWSSAARKMDCRTTKSSSPLLGLVTGVIRSSGGVPRPENADFLSANFADVPAGMLCARRIQWALEGLAEYDAFRGASAAIVVDLSAGAQSGAGSVASGAALSQGEVEPGKIVLAPGVNALMEGLPGIVLGEGAADGCRDWSWKTVQPNATYAADEQAVLGLIHAAGRTDPGLQTQPAPPTPSPRVPTQQLSSREIPSQEFTNQPEFSTGSFKGNALAGKSSRMPILIGSAGALVVLVLALVFVFMRKAPVQSATPGSLPAVTEQQSQPAVQKQAPARSSSSAKKAAKSEPQKPQANVETEAKPTALPVMTRCDLTEQEIERSLARADLYLHGGDLSNARATFQHVLGCPSAHEKAQEGLNRIQRMAAQNGSPDQ